MQALTRRGLLVLLDLVNSTEELLAKPAQRQRPLPGGEASLAEVISRLAEAFWQRSAETLAFTGDGLLVFIEDTGRPSQMSWALFDALREAEEELCALGAEWGVRLALRGAVHYGDVLEVVDGPFASQLIGRTICQMEEICGVARRADRRPGVIASVAATASAVRYCQLPVYPFTIGPDVEARLLSGRGELWLLDQPPLAVRKPSPVTKSPARYCTRSEGLVLYLGFEPSHGGHAFPDLQTYLRCMWWLVELASFCGAEILNIMPTAVLGFIEDADQPVQQATWMLRALFGGKRHEGCGLVKAARQDGWEKVRLVAGVAYGEITRPSTGPLVRQALGAVLAFAARFARMAASVPRESPLCAVMPYGCYRFRAPLGQRRIWREIAGADIPATSGPKVKLDPDKQRNLTTAGYSSAWVFRRPLRMASP